MTAIASQTDPATTHVLRDAATMLSRNLTHVRRDPSQVLVVIALPIIFLLLFVYVFGATLGSGIGVEGTSGYLDYVMPGVLALGIAAGAQGTAVSVCTDMTEGIISRFRTMAISRAAVLTGHVVGAMLQIALGLAGVVGLALLLGYRPDATVTDWAGVIGVSAMITFALTWLAVAIGTFARTATTASNMPMPLVLLPFLGSGFVPADTMPDALRWFAQNQPFTPFVDSLRGLLAGQPDASAILAAAAWCAGISLVGYVWALTQYNRRSVR
jgi:ABC-2 type transport system permease protein